MAVTITVINVLLVVQCAEGLSLYPQLLVSTPLANNHSQMVD